MVENFYNNFNQFSNNHFVVWNMALEKKQITYFLALSFDLCSDVLYSKEWQMKSLSIYVLKCLFRAIFIINNIIISDKQVY